jgi:hypothetical protein
VLILPILILAKSQAVWFAIPILFLISHFPNYIRFWHLFLGHILTPLLLLKLTFLKEESLVVRNTIFTNSLALLGQNPLIGIGFFGNITNLEKLRTAQALKLLQPVHNLFWFALTSLGSFVVILGLFFSKIKLVLSTKASSSLPLSAIIITGAFDHYWFTQQQTLLLLAFIISQSSFFKASNK